MLICHSPFFKSLTLNELMFGADLLSDAYPHWHHWETVRWVFACETGGNGGGLWRARGIDISLGAGHNSLDRGCQYE